MRGGVGQRSPGRGCFLLPIVRTFRQALKGRFKLPVSGGNSNQRSWLHGLKGSRKHPLPGLLCYDSLSDKRIMREAQFYRMDYRKMILRRKETFKVNNVNSKIMKFAVLLLAATLSLSCFTACGADENKSGTRVVFTTGFGKDEVFRIEDISCTQGELMVYLTTTQNQYENVYGTEIWNTSLDGVTLEENVKETVLAKIAQIKTMYLLAKEKEIVLEEQEEGKVKAAAEEYFQGLNETEIELMGITQETVEKLYKEYAMADKVYHQIIQDVTPEISDDEARTITVQHILIRTNRYDGAGNRVPFTEAAKQAAYEKACEVRELAVDGKHDFTELASKYSEDTNITYSFGKGEMEEAYEAAAFQLETDEVSQVVESEIGYHIIKCVSTFNREETDANKLKIVEQRKNEVFGQEYNKFVDTLVRNLNQELWNQISLIHNSEVTTSNFFEVYGEYFPD